MKTSLQIAALAIIGVVGWTNSSSAVTASATCTGIPLQSTELAANISCTKFDNVGGTLTLQSISMQINGTISGSINLFDNSPTNDATAAKGRTISNFSLSGGLPGFAFGSPLFSAQYTTNGNVAIDITPVNNVGNQLVFSGLSASGATSTLINNTSLGGYQTNGAGSFLIGISTESSLSLLGGGGNLGGSQTTSASADAVVIYTYQETVQCTVDCPEPASMALFGTALAGMGALRRRRKTA